MSGVLVGMHLIENNRARISRDRVVDIRDRSIIRLFAIVFLSMWIVPEIRAQQAKDLSEGPQLRLWLPTERSNRERHPATVSPGRFSTGRYRRHIRDLSDSRVNVIATDTVPPKPRRTRLKTALIGAGLGTAAGAAFGIFTCTKKVDSQFCELGAVVKYGPRGGIIGAIVALAIRSP